MKIHGRTIKGTKTVRAADVEIIDEKLPYRDLLERCLLDVCRELEIPVPLWLRKNTKEFANFRTTMFTSEQFVEKVTFDRFEIKVEG